MPSRESNRRWFGVVFGPVGAAITAVAVGLVLYQPVHRFATLDLSILLLQIYSAQVAIGLFADVFRSGGDAPAPRWFRIAGAMPAFAGAAAFLYLVYASAMWLGLWVALFDAVVAMGVLQAGGRKAPFSIAMAAILAPISFSLYAASGQKADLLLGFVAVAVASYMLMQARALIAHRHEAI